MTEESAIQIQRTGLEPHVRPNAKITNYFEFSLNIVSTSGWKMFRIPNQQALTPIACFQSVKERTDGFQREKILA